MKCLKILNPVFKIFYSLEMIFKEEPIHIFYKDDIFTEVLLCLLFISNLI